MSLSWSLPEVTPPSTETITGMMKMKTSRFVVADAGKVVGTAALFTCRRPWSSRRIYDAARLRIFQGHATTSKVLTVQFFDAAELLITCSNFVDLISQQPFSLSIVVRRVVLKKKGEVEEWFPLVMLFMPEPVQSIRTLLNEENCSLQDY